MPSTPFVCLSSVRGREHTMTYTAIPRGQWHCGHCDSRMSVRKPGVSDQRPAECSEHVINVRVVGQIHTATDMARRTES